MRKQIRNSLSESSAFIFCMFTILLMTTLQACQKETSRNVSNDSQSSDPVTFQKTYGGPNDEYIGDVQQTSDSGYIVIGTTKSYGAGDEDIYLIKVNAQGNIQWTKTYGEIDAEEGYNIKQTKDGGYIVSGAGYSENYILIKADEGGNLQWSRNYLYFGSSDYDVQVTDDGGYIIVGSYAGYNAKCIKTDENGNILWCKNFDFYWVSIAKTIDGGYAIVGERDLGYGGSYAQLIKIDADGNLLWSKVYGAGVSYPSSLKNTTDGSFIITGAAYVIKTDASGNEIWFKTYGGTEFSGACEIEETADGGYVFSGMTENYGEDHAAVIKTDSSGKVTWSKTFGGGKEAFSYVHQTMDKGFIIASQTSALGAGGSDIYLIKTDDNGNVGCYENSFNINVTVSGILVRNFPVQVSIGSIYYDKDIKSGTGGIETTVCPE